MKQALRLLILLTVALGYSYGQSPNPALPATPSAPSFSPSSCTGACTVTITSTGTVPSGAVGIYIFYTLDGSTPDYTSPRIPTGGTVSVGASQTLKAIAGIIAQTTAGSGSTPYESSSTANYKAPDCAQPGISGRCASDDPGGSGIPVASTLTDPAGSAPTGLTTSNCRSNGGAGPCMSYAFTPTTTSQTNVLWARSGGLTSGHPVPTWTVADSYVFYPTSNSPNVTYEHDVQIFDPQDTTSDYTHGLNYQFGMQCTKCTTSSANWEFGGTTNTHWIPIGITQPFVQGVWHHLVREDRRYASELASRPCYGRNNTTGSTVNFPCQYYWRINLDGASYDLQHGTCTGTGCSPSSFTPCASRAAGSGQVNGTIGCTLTTDELECSVNPNTGVCQAWGDNVTNQYQMDISGSTAPESMMVDNAVFTSLWDPSAVSTLTASGGAPVTSYSFTPATSNATIVSALAAGSAGGITYTWGAGTYTQSTAAWQFQCIGGNVFQGPAATFVVGTGVAPTAKFQPTTSNSNAVSLSGTASYASPGDGCTISGIDFNLFGMNVIPPVSGLHLITNSFEGIVGKVSGGTNAASWAGFYVDNGQQYDIQNSLVEWNTFGPSCADLDGLTTDQGGGCGGIVVQGSNKNLTIQNNNVKGNIEQFANFQGQSTSGNTYGQYSNNLLVQNNDMKGVHRAGISDVQSNTNNVVFRYNDLYAPYTPMATSEGIAAQCCFSSGGATSPGVVIYDNLLVYNTTLPSGVTASPKYAVEMWGNASQANGNLIQSTNNGGSLVLSGSSSGVGSANQVEGDTFQGASTGFTNVACGNGGTIPSCTDNTGATVSGNTYITSGVTTQASAVPNISPATGTFGSAVTVTLSTLADNNSIYYTTDGSTPVPNSGTTQLYTAPFSVTPTAVVNAVGMWGAGANPVAYPSGVGWAPSAMATATYTAGTAPILTGVSISCPGGTTTPVSATLSCQANCTYNSGTSPLVCGPDVDANGTQATNWTSTVPSVATIAGCTVANGIQSCPSAGTVTGVAVGSTNVAVSVNNGTLSINKQDSDETLSGWKAVLTTGVGGTGTPTSATQTIGNASPSLDGSSMQFSTVYAASQPQTNTREVFNAGTCVIGGSDICVQYNSDFWFQLGSNSAKANAFEMSMFDFDNVANIRYNWSMQFCQPTSCPGGVGNEWDICAGDSATCTWQYTGITGALTYSTWHHLQVTNHRVPGETACSGKPFPCTYFDSFKIDNTNHTLSTALPAAALPAGWSAVAGIQFQTDIPNQSSAQTVVWNIDEANYVAGSGLYFNSTDVPISIVSAGGGGSSILGNSNFTTVGSLNPNYIVATYAVTGPSSAGYTVGPNCNFYIPPGSVTSGGKTDCGIILAPSATTKASSWLCHTTYTAPTGTSPNGWVAQSGLSGCGTLPANTGYLVAIDTNDTTSPPEGFWNCGGSGSGTCNGAAPTSGNGTYAQRISPATYGTYTGLATTTTAGGSFQSSQYVTLSSVSSVTLVSISITTLGNNVIFSSLPVTMIATCLYSDNTSTSCGGGVADSHGNTATWSSDTTSAATITSAGVMHPVASGTPNITATVGSVSSPAYSLTIITLASISISNNGSTTLSPGNFIQFSAQATYDNGYITDCTSTDQFGTLCAWNNSSPAYATINSNGLLNAIKQGTDNVNATATALGGAAIASPITTITVLGNIINPFRSLGKQHTGWPR